MLFKTLPIGLEQLVTVDRIGGKVVFAIGDDRQAYVLLGGDHAVHPEVGKRYLMRFTEGGPSGGYWRIIEETALLPSPAPAPRVAAMCDKFRYESKKQAVTAINRRTQGHQRHRPRNPLRAYPCPECSGWHLTSQEKNND